MTESEIEKLIIMNQRLSLKLTQLLEEFEYGKVKLEIFNKEVRESTIELDIYTLIKVLEKFEYKW